jgi:ssRNA-specific RNase YbeY (16S rRNA maturation enzyme)
MIEVVNRQRHFKLDTDAWTTFATKALAAIGKTEPATIAFVSDKKIRELNRQFRGVDRSD